MTQAYVVTEGQFDVEILQKLLPNNIVQETNFLASSGAPSLAHTLLFKKQLPVAVVITTHTVNAAVIRERLNLLRYSIGPVPVGVRYKILTAVPEIEVVFFQEKSPVRPFTFHRYRAAMSREQGPPPEPAKGLKARDLKN